MTVVASGTVSGDTLTVPAGVKVGDSLVVTVAGKTPTYGSPFITWPSGLSRYNPIEFPTDGAGAWEQSYILAPFAHDGRSEYQWTFPSGEGNISYAFIGSPNTGGFPSGGSDGIIGATTHNVGESGTSYGTLTWADGPDGTWFVEPASPFVWQVRWWAYSDASNTRVQTGIVAYDAKSTSTQLPPPDDAWWYLNTYTIANPATGSAPSAPLLAWRTEGWIIHALGGTPPLRQSQRDDIRQGQHTSRQLTVRQVGYL